MATFKVNEGIGIGESTIEAETYGEVGSYTTFYDEDGRQVASVKTSNIHEIKRLTEVDGQ